MFGNTDLVGAGGVGNCDSILCRRIHIYIVRNRAALCDYFQVFRGSNDVPGELASGCTYYRISITYQLDKFLFIRVVAFRIAKPDVPNFTHEHMEFTDFTLNNNDIKHIKTSGIIHLH